MPHGGKREGSGRKKGSKATHTLAAEAMRMALIEKYKASAEKVNQALIDKAIAGDIAAIRELHDRVWGKANQPLELEGELDLNESIEINDEQYAQLIRAAASRIADKKGSE